jgi:A/G-specific adenine glycosylase
VSRLHAPLLRWYRRVRRPLPWRKDGDPYRVWVSEIMLQQTTVAAVTPKYEAFMARFPTLKSLACASEDAVLKQWAGLGYYSRARNLRIAAQKMNGVFPTEYEDILALPGVGRYTTGAIGSIAFSKPWPLVDGNVARVFSRLFGMKGRAKDPAFLKTLWPKAQELVHRTSPGDWNQALMELGATVCTPESPSCGACPLSGECVAFAKGLQDQLPVPEKMKAPVPVRWDCLWIEENGNVLLWKRGEKDKLLKGLWGLPERSHVAAAPGKRLATTTHSITHHALTVNLTEARLSTRKDLPPAAAWVKKAKLNDYLVSSLWLKLLREKRG